MDREKNSNSKYFSWFFFVNLFLSLVFSLLILFLFVRLKTTENSFSDQFSKILINFQVSFENSFYKNPYIKDWFNPRLKNDEQEKFQKYKLSILAKTINTFFKNILVETQNQIATENLQNFIIHKKSADLEKLKSGIKQHILNNPDIREVSTYDLEGNKIFGIRYKDSLDYAFNQEVIDELVQNKNLLLKRGEDSNLILLSVIENFDKKPFLIISQSIHKDFFNRILHHLEVDQDVFYIKDSKNFVLFDNHDSVVQSVGNQTSLRVFKTLTRPEERSLKVNLNSISYSLGTIVQKNNIWGNLVAIGFILLSFVLSFFCIDFILTQIKKISQRVRQGSYLSDTEMEPVLQEIPLVNPTSQKAGYESSSFDSSFHENYQKIKPLTLEQYLLKERKNPPPNELDR